MSLRSSAREHAHHHEDAADAAVAVAVSELKARGERITAPRRSVLSVLASSHNHLTADEIVGLLEPADVHRASVYRTLDLLTDAGVVVRRHVAGAASFHLASAAVGHEHLHGHCRICGAVVPLPITGMDAAVAGVAAETGFTVDPLLSTLVGTCEHCAAASS